MRDPGGGVTTCDAISLELPALVTGELNEAQTQTVETHLLTCDRCRHELIEVRKTIGLVSRAPLELSAPAHLETDVFTFLELEPVASAVRRMVPRLPSAPPPGWSASSPARRMSRSTGQK